jgi:outer membrane beta-barrel protein
MKKILSFITIIVLSSQGHTASDLEKKLDSLNIPTDKVTPLVSKENLTAINGRYSPLNKRHEVTFLGANNFTADTHMDTKQLGASYRFHLNSRWSFGLKYSEYKNKLTDAGEKLFKTKTILPDSDFAIKSSEGFVNFNTVYGKLRLTQKTIVYFDQYISIGYGKVALESGEVQMYSTDLGFSFWFGKHLSTRVGLKNEFYEQKRLVGSRNVQNAMGYLEFGYLFGGKTI